MGCIHTTLGGARIPREVVPDDDCMDKDKDKELYVDMALTHQSALLSYCSDNLFGLKKWGFYMDMRKVDAAGNELVMEKLCTMDVL